MTRSVRVGRIATLIAVSLLAVARTDVNAQTSADSLKHCLGVDIRYDKIEGVTTLEVDGEELPEITTELSLHATSVGKRLRTTSVIEAFFVTVSPGWQFLDAHAVSIVLDGATRLSLATKHDGKVLPSAKTYENVIARISASQAARIGRAKKVEGRIGIYDFTLNPKHIAGFRAAAQSISQGLGESYRYTCAFPSKESP